MARIRVISKLDGYPVETPPARKDRPNYLMGWSTFYKKPNKRMKLKLKVKPWTITEIVSILKDGWIPLNLTELDNKMAKMLRFKNY